MKAYANVAKLADGRYISQILLLLPQGHRVVATTAYPRASRNVASRDGFALKSDMLRVHR